MTGVYGDLVENVLCAFKELKYGHHRYMTLKLDASYTTSIDKIASYDANYSDFLNALPDNDCRFGLCDFPYIGEDGCDRNKVVFVLWCPDRAKVKAKMLYCSLKDSIRKHLVGIRIEFSGTDKDELSEQEILEKCLRYPSPACMRTMPVIEPKV